MNYSKNTSEACPRDTAVLTKYMYMTINNTLDAPCPDLTLTPWVVLGTVHMYLLVTIYSTDTASGQIITSTGGISDSHSKLSDNVQS